MLISQDAHQHTFLVTYRGLSRTLLGFLFAGAMVGLFTLGAGLLAGDAKAEGNLVIECGVFPPEHARPSTTSEFRFTSPTGQAGYLEVDFLTLGRQISATRSVELPAGTTAVFSLLTRDVGPAVQVIAAAPVQVEATLLSDGSVGSVERQAVSCNPIQQPARG